MLTRETSAPGEVSFYRLRIVPGTEAEEDAWKTIVLEAKGLEDPVLTWNPDAPIVLLSYTRGEIMRFHNVWIDEAAYTPGVDQDHIEIRLDPRCEGMCF